jgi:hypothetical protein
MEGKDLKLKRNQKEGYQEIMKSCRKNTIPKICLPKTKNTTPRGGSRYRYPGKALGRNGASTHSKSTSCFLQRKFK